MSSAAVFQWNKAGGEGSLEIRRTQWDLLNLTLYALTYRLDQSMYREDVLHTRRSPLSAYGRILGGRSDSIDEESSDRQFVDETRLFYFPWISTRKITPRNERDQACISLNYISKNIHQNRPRGDIVQSGGRAIHGTEQGHGMRRQNPRTHYCASRPKRPHADSKWLTRSPMS